MFFTFEDPFTVLFLDICMLNIFFSLLIEIHPSFITYPVVLFLQFHTVKGIEGGLETRSGSEV